MLDLSKCPYTICSPEMTSNVQINIPSANFRWNKTNNSEEWKRNKCRNGNGRHASWVSELPSSQIATISFRFTANERKQNIFTFQLNIENGRQWQLPIHLHTYIGRHTQTAQAPIEAKQSDPNAYCQIYRAGGRRREIENRKKKKTKNTEKHVSFEKLHRNRSNAHVATTKSALAQILR